MTDLFCDDLILMIFDFQSKYIGWRRGSRHNFCFQFYFEATAEMKDKVISLENTFVFNLVVHYSF